ncbi:GGDEF domain-containing protein [Sphingomonas profundi]|uniref:GGDEF domain-containing protein n=1 Tax=Alterirhizorhabdus profundi TaxID=2681549 RepID=UPI0012E7326A|nr:diguanylate cyclase [Sphingomonas profundi]
MIGRLSSLTAARLRQQEPAPIAREDAQRKLFRLVGEFLGEHHLAPTPGNYAVAHAVVTGSHPEIVRAVREATFGDLRLSQVDADAIHARCCQPQVAISGAAASVAELVRAVDEARERFDRYAGIVDSSRQDAQAYGDALASEAATMRPARETSGAETVAALMALTESMIDKTRRAEEQLRAASAEMDDLRANLAIARQDAETDPLTGLPNRRAFEACFAECLAGAGQRTVSLALCDIDRFKGVNDRYGHDVGDRVIRLVAKELAQGCDGSVVARYGGEEFVILFEGRELDLAYRLLDRTREALSDRSFKVAGTGETLADLSFSGGVVAVAPGEDIREALRRADAALYRAKQTGRNRIERGL